MVDFNIDDTRKETRACPTKKDWLSYRKEAPEEHICKCVVGVVDKLMDHRLEFERFADKQMILNLRSWTKA